MADLSAATLTVDERALLDLIDLDEIVALTQALVRAPGGNPPGAEAAEAQVLVAACSDRGLSTTSTEVEPQRPNVSAALSGGPGPGLLVLGHTDVVPVGDGWTVDPYGGAVREGRLYGRGSTIMLGGLDELEATAGMPVLTANQVTRWEGCALVGEPPRLDCLGTLFNPPRPALSRGERG